MMVSFRGSLTRSKRGRERGSSVGRFSVSARLAQKPVKRFFLPPSLSRLPFEGEEENVPTLR
ncbi:MAG: hypothetical protein ACTS47_01305 [Candidatus Hodgkinia cicadicola]